jgi:putative metal-binding protein
VRAHRIVVVAACCLALGCAKGGAAASDDAASFGPGGNSHSGQATGDTETMGSGTDGSSNSNSNSGTNSNSSTAADTAGDGNCVDNDGDDYGDGCAAGEDCDDDDPDINPGATEECGDGIDSNCDMDEDAGCDCPDDGVSGNCNMPTDLGTLMAAGDNVLGVVGNVAQEDAIEWYTVSFPAAARPGAGTPTINFAINEDDSFVFDVVTGQCDAAGAACTTGGTGGTAVALTEWTFTDNDPGCCTPPTDSMVAWPNQIFLRVYRTTSGVSCSKYQLQATR